MNFTLESLLIMLFALVAVVGVPASIVGWRRPKLEPRITHYVVFGSILVFSAFMAFMPQIQRDWFTFCVGVFVIGGGGGFICFVVFVNLSEYIRTNYPSTSFGKRVLEIQRGR